MLVLSIKLVFIKGFCFIMHPADKPQMISKFPEFKRLELTDKAFLRAFTAFLPTYSDFNFTSLFSWDVQEVAEASNLNGNLVLKFTDYNTGKHFYTFIGIHKVDETIKTLLRFAEEHGTDKELLLIPHSTVQALEKPEFFEINEDIDNHDYILSVDDLVEFKSNKYRGKRNLLNRFERFHGEKAVTKEIDVTDENTRKQIDLVTYSWTEMKNKTIADVESELRAIKRCLDNATALNTRGFGVFVGDEMVAYTLFELLPNKFATIHFCKADTKFVGVFEHMNHNLAKHLSTLDIAHINMEQDLGLPGLRNSKQSYHPVHFLKKYKVKLKTN